MKKSIIFAVCCLTALIVVCLPRTVTAEKAANETLDSAIESSLEETDLTGLEEYYNSYSEQMNTVTGGATLKDFISDLASGRMFTDYDSILQYIKDQLLGALLNSMPFLTQVLAIALLFSLLSAFYPQFGGAHKAAEYAKYILICGMTVSVFLAGYKSSASSIKEIAGFSQKLFPLLFLLLASVGGLNGASILKPAASVLTGVINVFVDKLVSPLMLLLAALTALTGFSSRFKISGMTGLIKSIIKWVIGVSFVLFLGCVSLQGLIATSYDGITLKAAKYTIDKAVPVVGGAISDTMDMLIVSSLLIKNAVGVCGILIIVSMLAAPAVSLIINCLVLKFAGALTETLGFDDVSKFLHGMSDVMVLQNAVLLVSGAMFIINIGLILGSGNINIMMR